MTQDEIKRLWLGVVVVILASTYPSWINRGGGYQSSYDAPWIYPSMNPVVQSELHSSVMNDKLSLAK